MDFKTYYANQQKLVENYLQNRIAKKVFLRSMRRWNTA